MRSDLFDNGRFALPQDSSKKQIERLISQSASCLVPVQDDFDNVIGSRVPGRDPRGSRGIPTIVPDFYIASGVGIHGVQPTRLVGSGHGHGGGPGMVAACDVEMEPEIASGSSRVAAIAAASAVIDNSDRVLVMYPMSTTNAVKAINMEMVQEARTRMFPRRALLVSGWR